jgi:glyoxalase family protein
LITIGGIHHITSIAADPKRTEEFYAGTLGLHLVKKTVNFDEPSVLHFYFGDRRGSPGSMITFFVHEAEPPGRCGPGHVSSIVFAVPPGTLDLAPPPYFRAKSEQGPAVNQSTTSGTRS